MKQCVAVAIDADTAKMAETILRHHNRNPDPDRIPYQSGDEWVINISPQEWDWLTSQKGGATPNQLLTQLIQDTFANLLVAHLLHTLAGPSPNKPH